MYKQLSHINMEFLIDSDQLKASFLDLVRIDSGSEAERAETRIPSTERQWDIARVLVSQLEMLGLADVTLSQNCIVTATLPGNLPPHENNPVIGLIAHLDTAPAVPTGPVHPQVRQYTGGDIQLAGDVVIEADDLKDQIGHEVITSDGTTLLGADDKAGVAEILETLRVLNAHPEIQRPTLRIAFTPDEETGMGAAKFDIPAFGADAAYTVDGEAPNELENGTFNAFGLDIICSGKNVHPGMAYGKMINSIKMATDIIQGLPADESPETTKDMQGYYHVCGIHGEEESTRLKMIVRDFDFESAEQRVAFVNNLAERVKAQHPGSEITVKSREQYRNMAARLQEFPEVVDFGLDAIRESDMEPHLKSIRGGTDGSQLTLRGLLTPNLGAGGHNFHSKNEFVSTQDMVKCTQVVLNLVRLWAERAGDVAEKIAARRNA